MRKYSKSATDKFEKTIAKEKLRQIPRRHLS